MIASDTWMGGNIAVHLNRHVLVYIDADDRESPWFASGTALLWAVIPARPDCRH